MAKSRVKKEEDCPLSAKHLEAINALLESCPRTRDFLQQCADCHLDVKVEQRQNDEQETIIRKIKAKFFPNEV